MQSVTIHVTEIWTANNIGNFSVLEVSKKQIPFIPSLEFHIARVKIIFSKCLRDRCQIIYTYKLPMN